VCSSDLEDVLLGGEEDEDDETEGRSWRR